MQKNTLLSRSQLQWEATMDWGNTAQEQHEPGLKETKELGRVSERHYHELELLEPLHHRLWLPESSLWYRATVGPAHRERK